MYSPISDDRRKTYSVANPTVPPRMVVPCLKRLPVSPRSDGAARKKPQPPIGRSNARQCGWQQVLGLLLCGRVWSRAVRRFVGQAAAPCTATSPTSRIQLPAAPSRTTRRSARSTPTQPAPPAQANCSAAPADTPARAPTTSRTREPPTTAQVQPPTAPTAPAPCTTKHDQHPSLPPVGSNKPKREASISRRRLCPAAHHHNPPSAGKTNTGQPSLNIIGSQP